MVVSYPSVTNTHTQLALKQQVEAYVQVREEARHAQQQLEEARREEERMQRRLATKEVEQFRQRVSTHGSLSVLYLSAYCTLIIHLGHFCQ